MKKTKEDSRSTLFPLQMQDQNIMKEQIKSPLRYPGGKTRAVSIIVDKYIKNQPTLCSPFMGGGSIEIALAKRGTTVYAYDDFKPLVIFWKTLLKNPQQLADRVMKYKNITKEIFYSLQKNLTRTQDTLELAAMFFVLNRSSFSGTTLSGGMSPGCPRFTYNSIERLRRFALKNLTVEHMDFKTSIKKHSSDFLYCDPPYLINQKLYGNKGDKHSFFDHLGLSLLLKKRERWILSYNDCSEIRKLYNGHLIIRPEWSYGMGSNKKSKELLIFSKDFKPGEASIKWEIF